MNWLSEKVGRPKEEGGHKRVNVSLSQETLEILNEFKRKYADDVRKSQLIEMFIEVGSVLAELSPDLTNFMLEQLIDLLKKFGKW